MRGMAFGRHGGLSRESHNLLAYGFCTAPKRTTVDGAEMPARVQRLTRTQWEATPLVQSLARQIADAIDAQKRLRAVKLCGVFGWQTVTDGASACSFVGGAACLRGADDERVAKPSSQTIHWGSARMGGVCGESTIARRSRDARYQSKELIRHSLCWLRRRDV